MSDNENDNSEQQKSITISSYLNQDITAIAENLSSQGIEVVKIGDGKKIVAQYPSVGEVVVGDKVFLISEDTNLNIPNITGWSRADVTTLANLLNLSVEFNQYGYVVKYELIDNTLKVTLGDKYITKKE